MSNLSRFMKSNKKVKANTTYPATKSLVGEDGKPLEWTIRPVSSKKMETLRDECTYDVQITGKPNLFRPKLNNAKFSVKLACASIVEPNLYDKELQDSYGVQTPEELVTEMIDSPAEWDDFIAFLQQFNDYTPLEEKVEEAKN